MITLLGELGLPSRWAVLGTKEQPFFNFTKRMHNLIHGAGEPGTNDAEREVYEAVNKENADDLRRQLKSGDLVVVHDPQPMGLAPLLKDTGARFVWRCHIGLDGNNAQTDTAWKFLQKYADAYEHAVFTAPEYVPSCFSDRNSIIHPALDPLSFKNQDLAPTEVAGILVKAGLLPPPRPNSRRFL